MIGVGYPLRENELDPTRRRISPLVGVISCRNHELAARYRDSGSESRLLSDTVSMNHAFNWNGGSYSPVKTIFSCLEGYGWKHDHLI